MALRDDVNKALELARAEKVVGKPLDAKVTVSVADEAKAAWETVKDADLAALCIVSEFCVSDEPVEGWAGTELPGVTVKVEASQLPKCPRCWTHSAGIGSDAEHPELCPRCAGRRPIRNKSGRDPQARCARPHGRYGATPPHAPETGRALARRARAGKDCAMIYAIAAVLVLILDQGLKYWVTVNIALDTGADAPHTRGARPREYPQHRAPPSAYCRAAAGAGSSS